MSDWDWPEDLDHPDLETKTHGVDQGPVYEDLVEEQTEDPPFDTRIDGYNRVPLAARLDPDGYPDLMWRKAPQLKHYASRVPRTLDVAKAMLGRIKQRKVWGLQTETKWATVTLGKWSSVGNRGGRKQETAINLTEILKHLCGRGYARGTTDRPYNWSTWVPGVGFVYNLVPCLRIDVDLVSPIIHLPDFWTEVHAEQQVVEAMGFGYEVFLTGHRGWQVIIPLPKDSPHVIASFVLEIILDSWEYRGKFWHKYDKTNLHEILRLPGGIHALTGNGGYWIDTANESLHGIEAQARLMYRGFDFKGGLDPGTYFRAGKEILGHLEAQGYLRHGFLNRAEALSVMADHADNDLVKALEQGRAAARTMKAGRSQFSFADASLQVRRREVRVQVEAETAQIQEAAAQILQESETARISTASREAGVGDLAWAKRVWSEAYGPGGHWEFISMGHRKGILAATLLFGQSGAEAALIDLATRTAVASEGRRQERIHTIRQLWKTFWYQTAQPRPRAPIRRMVLREATAEVEALADQIIASMLEKQPKPRWNVSVTRLVALVLLIELTASPEGEARLSSRDIAETINDRWPHASTNQKRVLEAVGRMSEGGLVDAFWILRETQARRAVDAYRCGDWLLERGMADLMQCYRTQEEVIK